MGEDQKRAQSHWTYCALPTDEGERLDRVLSQGAVCHEWARIRALSREQLKGLIASGHVTRTQMDGAPPPRVPIQPSQRVRTGDLWQIALPAPAQATLVPHAMPLDILYDDADIVVLNKPAHLPVHPGAGVRRPTLVSGLLAHCGDLAGIGGVLRPGVVHRLDADTTGAMVFAKHDIAHRALAAQFAARKVTKRYLALVVHAPLSRALAADGFGRYQRLVTPFGRHPSDRKRFTAHAAAGGKVREAASLVRVIGHEAPLLLVEVALETGRTHQIRVHLAETLGPVLRDRLYRPKVASRAVGGSYGPKLDLLGHHALHACQLDFVHPVSHKPLRFVAPVPESWRSVAAAMGPSDAFVCLAAPAARATVQPHREMGSTEP